MLIDRAAVYRPRAVGQPATLDCPNGLEAMQTLIPVNHLSDASMEAPHAEYRYCGTHAVSGNQRNSRRHPGEDRSSDLRLAGSEIPRTPVFTGVTYMMPSENPFSPVRDSVKSNAYGPAGPGTGDFPTLATCCIRPVPDATGPMEPNVQSLHPIQPSGSSRRRLNGSEKGPMIRTFAGLRGRDRVHACASRCGSGNCFTTIRLFR